MHVILNGGFGDGDDRIALINYMTNLGVLDPSILPLILGAPNGQNFFISSLVEAVTSIIIKSNHRIIYA